MEGYEAGLTRFLDHAGDERFVRPVHRDMLLVENDVDRLLDRLISYTPPVMDKGIDHDQT